MTGTECRHEQEDSFKLVHRDIVCEDLKWIGLVKDRFQEKAFVVMLAKLHFIC